MASSDLKMQSKTPSATQGETTKSENYFSPLVNIYETPEAVTVVADIPGVQKEDVEIALDENILTIHGQMKTPAPEGRLLLKEYEIGHFMRRFTVAETIDQGNIQASLANGVLKVILPKVLPAKPRKIEVQMG